MTVSSDNRFQDFFTDDKYVLLKNFLYNYLLRKRAVEKAMQNEEKDIILEIGSGISPVLSSWDRIVYSDLSLSALNILRRHRGKGHYVVADGANLPFKGEAFSHVISSEVLEHLADDRKALCEMARVIKPEGGAVITFPHRRFYFANDDRFVNHHRRYELPDMVSRLQEAGLYPLFVRKVLGPLEKVTMIIVVGSIALLQGTWGRERQSKQADAMIMVFKWTNIVYAVLARIDAWIMPRTLSTVLLIKAVRCSEPEKRPQMVG
jgi:ubiquinone/menaquinone biosynthesis C-methylase UbiE